MEDQTTQSHHDDKKNYVYELIKETLFPKRCLFCFTEGFDLCENHKNFPKFIGKKEISKDLEDLFIACDYENKEIQKIIEHFKFKNFQDLGKTMARLVYEELLQEKSQDFFSDFVIIPISLHWRRKLWRGYNQSEILAKELQIHLKIPMNTNLKRTKRTKQQAHLKKDDRFLNLEDAFVWNGEKIPGKILLIDDVYTTGSTLEAAAKVLQKAGAREIIGVVFAGGN